MVRPLLLPIAAVAAGAAWLLAAAQAGARVSFERFVLPNGLTVIVHENHDRPLAHVRMFYNVGEKDAGPGQRGHGHLFEHLAFSRTEGLDRSVWDFLKSIGARDYDANSRYDFTNYYATLPAAAVDTVLWMESQRMAHLANVLTDRDLERSRREVFDEADRLLGVPPIRMLKETWDHTYPKGHPYAGFDLAPEDVNRATLLDARRFYARYYHPANAVLVVGGDVSPASVRTSAERHFGSIPAGAPRARMAPSVAQRQGIRRRRVEGIASDTRIRLVWNTPGWGTAAADYLELATTTITSRVRRRLREHGLTADVEGVTEMRALGGQVMVDVIGSPPARFRQIERIVREEIRRLGSDGVTGAELDLARAELRGRLGRNVADLSGVTLLLGTGELLAGDPGHFRLMLERAERATSEDVRRAVGAWLTDGPFVLEIIPARTR